MSIDNTSTYEYVENKGVFGELPLYIIVPAGALLILIYGIYGIRRARSCLKRLEEAQEEDPDLDKDNELYNRLYLHSTIFSAATGFNLGLLLITFIPSGIIRPTSFWMFAALMVWVIGQTMYYMNKIERSGECKSAYDKLTPIKSYLWGYLGGAIGVLIGLLFTTSMEAFGYSNQFRIVAILICMQLIGVNVMSKLTYQKCKDFGTPEQQDEMRLFNDFQKWPLWISSIVMVLVIVSFMFDRASDTIPEQADAEFVMTN